MKAAHVVLLAAVSGMAGWGGHVLYSPVDRSADEAAASTSEAAFSGASPSDARAATLAPRSPSASGGRALGDELSGALRGAGAAGLEEAARRGESGADRGVRGWAALLTLFAMGDRSADFLRAAPEAVRAGIDLDDLLECVRLFPHGREGEVLQSLLAGVREAEWPAVHVADMFVEAGDRERAVGVLASALEKGPHQALIERLVAVDPERAARLLQKLAAEGGWNTKRLQQASDALVAAGHPDLASGFLEAALKADPLNREVLERLSAVAPEKAIAHARRVAQEQGANPTALLNLGAAEMAGGNSKAAFEAYRQAATRSLTKDALEGMLRADPQAAYSAAIELAGPQTDSETLGAIARLALASDRTRESIDLLLRAHERDPFSSRWNAALVALDPARAAEVLAASAQSYHGRRRDDVVGAYGDALAETGKAGAAFDQYAEAFQLNPDRAAWQRGLARSDPARALPLLEARRRAVGDNGDLLGALADAYAGTGQASEARALYEKAVDRGGGLKWYARMGAVDPAGARARLEDATARNPQSDEAWGAFGDYYRVLGNAAAAHDAYAKARDLDPSSLVWAARFRASVPPTR